MKPFLLCAAVALFTAPLFAQPAGGDAKLDEATRAEFDAARKKFEAAKAELDKVQEKIKASRGEGGGEGKARPDMSTLPGFSEMLKNALQLKDEQYKKVQDLAAKGQHEMDANAAELKKTAEALDAERGKDAPDFAKAKELMEKRAKLASANELIRFKFNFDIKPILTPDQVTKLNELRKKMDERMKQGPRGQGGPGGGPGGGEGGRPPKRGGGE